MSILIYFATIFWSLFPNLIHVFQGGENFINKVNETNLVSNSDLLTPKPSPNQNQPLGFTFSHTTNVTLTNGIVSFTALNNNGLMYTATPLQNNINDKIYSYAKIKSDSNLVRFYTQTPSVAINVIGNAEFNHLSFITVRTETTTFNLYIRDYRESDWTPIEVDYIGAYNVSTMILNGVKNDNGISFSELTNVEIKTQLDIWITEYGDLSFTVTKDNTFDSWFNTGFVDKQAERDFLDYLGYFFWLTTPPILLFITLDIIRRLL